MEEKEWMCCDGNDSIGKKKKIVLLLSLANELYIQGPYWEDKNNFFWWEKNVSAAISDH